MIKRVIYNLILYWGFLNVIPFKEITDWAMKIGFIICTILLFNIALCGPRKTKHLGSIFGLLLSPFLIAILLNKLVGGIEVLYNYNLGIYCACDRAYHYYSIGWIYLIGVSFFYGIWRIVDQDRKPYYPMGGDSL